MSTTDNERNRQMLVADDDPAILRLIATILEKENYSVVTARDGREAYKILQAIANFTAAILDVVMPHISGPELVRYMKTEERLMNDSGDDDDRRTGSKALVGQFFRRAQSCFMPKPFTTAQLQIMLQMLIGKN